MFIIQVGGEWAVRGREIEGGMGDRRAVLKRHCVLVIWRQTGSIKGSFNASRNPPKCSRNLMYHLKAETDKVQYQAA